MRAPISIVIPTLDAGATLPGTLAALIEGLEAGLIREVVVSDGGSDDATRAQAEAAGAVWIAGAASRGGQLRRGAAAAQGDWLLFLHADTRLAPGWTTAVSRHMQERPNRAACFRLGFEDGGLPGRLVAGWANLRTRLFGLPYGDQPLLIARGLYEELGGFPDIPLMEDVALARALGRRRLALLDLSVRTSPARYVQEGWSRRGARNLWCLARYLAGTDPHRLAQGYRRRPRS